MIFGLIFADIGEVTLVEEVPDNVSITRKGIAQAMNELVKEG